MTNADTDRVMHNEAESRFELTSAGNLGLLEYLRDGNRIIFTHTEVPTRSRGQGHGAKLAAAALDYAAAHQLQVVPICSFIAHYIDEHPERRPLLGAAA